jgi:serine/threonine protein phosphatase PrpC
MPKIFTSSEYFKSEDFGLAVADTFYKIDELLETEEGKKELKKMGHVSSKAKSDSSKGLFSSLEDKLQESESAVPETKEEPKDHKKSTLKHVDSSERFIQSALARDSVVKVRTPTMGSQSPNDASTDSDDGETEFHAAGMGCTAVVAVIHGNKVVIANTGDSRCIISRKGVAEPLTLDHKPVLLEEAERIIKAGGFVRDNRVNGALNVSRTIGDLDFKRNTSLPHTHQMVVATPDITSFDLQKGDEFLILACDGIWDVMSNQEAVDFVRKRLKQRQSIKSICEEMCDNCLAPDLRGLCRGADNMSVIVVLFKHTADLLGPWSKLKNMMKF